MNRWIYPAALALLVLLPLSGCKKKDDDKDGGGGSAPTTYVTNDTAYLTSNEPGVVITPILTAGEEVPLTGSTTGEIYRMVGIPDGLGARATGGGYHALYMNHELGNSVSATPLPAGSNITGAFVSRYTMYGAAIVSGELAFDTVYQWSGSVFVDDTAKWTGGNGFGRFCSGFLADSRVGFDTEVYMTGEEAGGSGNYDGNGGSAVAIADGACYILPWMGHAAWENVVVVPGTGSATVVFGMEDAGSLTSQVYMYVGTKNAAGANAIERNGLQGGSLYVLNVSTAGQTGEDTYHKEDGTLTVTWSAVDPITNNTESTLETATQTAGSFDFVRVEDGAAHPGSAGTFFFTTTGNGAGAGNTINQLGRMYRLTFSTTNPATGAATLTCLLEGDRGDPVVNPDNIECNAAGQIMMCEDCNGEHRDNFLAGRDGGVWLYDIATKDCTLVAELNQLAVPAGMRGTAGTWESSGIMDASSMFGTGRWLIDVQAHSVSSSDASTLQGSGTDLNVAEGGQLLLLNLSGWVPPRSRHIWLEAAGGFTLNGTVAGDKGEISGFDPGTDRLFTIDPAGLAVEVWDISNPASPNFIRALDVSPGTPNSIAVYNGLVAVAVQDATKTNNGTVRFYEATNSNNLIGTPVTVGALPDMLTFTPNGANLLVANEGEPNDDYTTDPEGTVSIIPITSWAPGTGTLTLGSTVSIDFQAFNVGQSRAAEFPAASTGARIFGPGATRAQDVEPEYIAVSPDSSTAVVTLQENNCIAIINISAGTITSIKGLGFKDHSVTGDELDPSDRDGSTGPALNATIKLRTAPVFGMYQPDAIASFSIGGNTYYISANEGDARDYTGTPGFSEEARVSSLTLDTTAFPTAATLQQNGELGRYTVTTTLGDIGSDGDYEELYGFGARSFSIWDSTGTQVYDSGDDIERRVAQRSPGLHNSQGDNGSYDGRSDNKGPEPEGVTTGVIGGRTYAFITLERVSGVIVYDVTVPTAPTFVQFVRTDGDFAPEGIAFVSAADSPLANGHAMLIVSNEVSGTVRLYDINP
ncbi:MAG: choice-of-anchor I family protein [Planctomycetes bacterium]|nr:choice-of-anchor I family protein [Planctomycetota bacterium]